MNEETSKQDTRDEQKLPEKDIVEKVRLKKNRPRSPGQSD